MDASRRALRAGSAAFVAFGSAGAILGPILPSIRHDLHVGDVASGAFVGLAGAGFGIGVLASAPVQHHRGRRRSHLVGLLSIAVGCLMVAIAPSIAIATGGGAVLSFGGGMVAGAVNSAMAEVGASELALANAAFGVGAIVGPLVTASLVAGGMSWRLAPLLPAAFAISALPLGGDLPDGAAGGSGGRAVVGELFRSRIYVLLVALMAADILGDAGLAGWFPVYLVEARGAAPWLGAASTIVFWCGTALARAALSRVPERSNPAGPVPVLLAVAAVAVLATLAVSSPVAALTFALVAGAAAGPIFPLALTTMRNAFPDNVDAATAVLLGTSGLTEMALPLALGGTSSLAGTTAAGIAAVGTAYALAAAVGVLVSRTARATMIS